MPREDEQGQALSAAVCCTQDGAMFVVKMMHSSSMTDKAKEEVRLPQPHTDDPSPAPVIGIQGCCSCRVDLALLHAATMHPSPQAACAEQSGAAHVCAHVCQPRRGGGCRRATRCTCWQP